MRKLLAKIERLHFSGDTRRGERSNFIFRELARRNCSPSRDSHGNIWVMKGSGKPLVLFSSHMDVDPRISRKEVRRAKRGGGKLVAGVLDNAVGCTLNILLAQRGPKQGSAIYVFTASEEISARNPRVFARSSREVVRELAKRKLRPSLCVAIDVTYPRLLIPHHRMDWGKNHDELFYMMDTTHCYADGYLTRASRRACVKSVRKFRDSRVQVRNLPGYDEATVYCRIAPSFAFGPVVFGSFDRPDQSMPLAHMRTALRFLKSIATWG